MDSLSHFHSIEELTKTLAKEVIFALCFNKNELTNWGANWFYNVALFTNATDLDGNKYGPDPLKLLTACLLYTSRCV